MFTRFKSLTVVFFFLLSFMLMTLLWGENGYFERKDMERNLETLYSIASEREMELSLLRERNESEREREDRNLELVYSFDDDESILKDNGIDGFSDGFEGLLWWECVLWAFVPTSIYLVLIVVVPLFVKKKPKKQEEKKDGKDN